MGLFHDLLLETRAAQFEKDLKEAYGMGFRDGRLCPDDLRPCEVDGEPALFHAWASQDEGLLKIGVFTTPSEAENINRYFRATGIIPAGCTVEKLGKVRAIIEWPDGSVEIVPAEKVRFTDREASDEE